MSNFENNLVERNGGEAILADDLRKLARLMLRQLSSREAIRCVGNVMDPIGHETRVVRYSFQPLFLADSCTNKFLAMLGQLNMEAMICNRFKHHGKRYNIWLLRHTRFIGSSAGDAFGYRFMDQGAQAFEIPQTALKIPRVIDIQIHLLNARLRERVQISSSDHQGIALWTYPPLAIRAHNESDQELIEFIVNALKRSGFETKIHTVSSGEGDKKPFDVWSFTERQPAN